MNLCKFYTCICQIPKEWRNLYPCPSSECQYIYIYRYIYIYKYCPRLTAISCVLANKRQNVAKQYNPIPTEKNNIICPKFYLWFPSIIFFLWQDARSPPKNKCIYIVLQVPCFRDNVQHSEFAKFFSINRLYNSCLAILQ